MRNIIRLSGERELKIFMDPLRQRLLRTMELIAKPVTPKRLADVMGITPSAAKHHLVRLQSIGLVDVHHTEQIHGITAAYYALLPVTVSIGLDADDHARERALIAENLVMSVYKNFQEKLGHERPEVEPFRGDLVTGVAHLTQAQADALHAAITGYIEENAASRAGTMPFEYALILYNASET